ncbi:FixH family protein [Tsuneonella sp. YG55]|uniref:FixH family protein n=1 Tax=Tsuneonella litorea TaxID=2976475 RepID=A0A9X2W4H5_9SPHN|nr:FixH family protein [Tsuneonella litorea]MCT2559885.1 FixH family protein [Tsuneonella litorea]
MKNAFDGRHMAAILVAGFAVVISVNLGAAVIAKRTFGGIVVENSYAASQDFNGWLEEAARERALGWRVEPARRADGRVALALTGIPAGARIAGSARHPLGRVPDTALHFLPAPDGSAVSDEPLPPGRWILRVTVQADGKRFRSEGPLG